MKALFRCPLCADELDRPRQMVDRNKGKTAITHYKIIGKTPLQDSHYSEAVKVELCPITGRTHQLRVHCAHSEGLACPILGDTLYGKRADSISACRISCIYTPQQRANHLV